jgi:hypothetical protein
VPSPEKWDTRVGLLPFSFMGLRQDGREGWCTGVGGSVHTRGPVPMRQDLPFLLACVCILSWRHQLMSWTWALDPTALGPVGAPQPEGPRLLMRAAEMRGSLETVGPR